MTPAVAYLRMSSDKQDTSIPAQRDAIARLAKSGRFKLLREYVDAGISGDDTTRRVEFQRMIADAARGEFKAILCWDQDRFGRFDSLEAGFWILPLRNAGVQLVTVAQGIIDWTDFAGRLLFTVQQEGKHQFLRDLARNVVRGKAAAAQQGRWMGGGPPYGYRLNAESRLIVHDDEAEVVREVFRLYLTGLSRQAVRIELNRRGIVSPGGTKWHGNTVGTILTNPVYLGHTRYNRRSAGRYATFANGVVISKVSAKDVANDASLWITVENTHAAIVSAATFRKAQEMAQQHRKWTGSNRDGQIVFKGLLTCGHCGHRMHGAWIPQMGDICYACSQHWTTGGCQSNRTYQTPLLAAVMDAIRDDLLSPSAIAKARKRLLDSASAQASAASLATIQKRIDQLATKISKAESRLLEVPQDMISTVANQVRDLRSQHTAAVAERDAMTNCTKQGRSVEQAFDQAISDWRELVSSLHAGPSPELINLLREGIDSIDVTSELVHHVIGQRGKYELRAVVIHPRNT